jgi:hypothetical protein
MNNAVTGYNPQTNYLVGAVFLAAVHDARNTRYQDLAFVPPAGFNLLSTPEPSTLAIAGLGALGFLGYCLRRRAQSA